MYFKPMEMDVTDAFIQLDLAKTTGAPMARGQVLFPIDNRLVITTERELTYRAIVRRLEQPREPITEEQLKPPQTYVRIDGRKYPVIQDFDTVKTMLTGAGIKIIERENLQGNRELKISDPEARPS